MNRAAESGSGHLAPRSDTLALIERLIGFETVSRDSNLGLIESVRDELVGLGATARLTYDASGRKANLFATLGEGSRPGLILSGHTDVVPVDGQDWLSDPFTATVVGERLYARGSADMKGFLGVALAQAPRFLAAMNDGHLDCPIHYALSYDEEVGCLGVRGLIHDLQEAGIRPAACIVGEPTGMQPIIAHKGTHRFHCSVHGREAHSSYVTEGVNAIEFAARIVVFIRELADRLARQEVRDYGFAVPYSTLSTGLIRGGIAANVVPRLCDFQFDMRTLPGALASDLVDEIKAYIETQQAQMKAVDPDSRVDFEWSSSTDGLNASESDAIVQLAAQLARNPTLGRVSYGTEAGLFQQAGIPSVICGPGDITVAHRPNEYVELAQLAQCEAFMDGLLAPTALYPVTGVNA
jgi:acetylornithine deacetylase